MAVSRRALLKSAAAVGAPFTLLRLLRTSRLHLQAIRDNARKAE